MKRNETNGNRRAALFIALLIVVLDQLTKLAITRALALNESKVIITKVLSLTYITNTGALFGMFRGMNLPLIVLGVVVVVWLICHSYTEASREKNIFFALIIGGALSNIIDRIAYGAVIDFINFHFWPAFNLADSAITIGVVAIVLYYIKNDSQKEN